MTGGTDGSGGGGRGKLRRVAIVSHSNCLYGASRSLLELVLSLQGMGLEVGVVLPEGGVLEKKLREYRCQIWNFRPPSWVSPSNWNQSTTITTLNDFAAAAKHIQQLLSDWRADLLWTNSSITPVGALAAKSLRIPHIWHLRELNGSEYGCEFKVSEAVAAELIRSADCRVAVSRTVKTHYESLGCGNCELIYNGIGPGSNLALRRRGDISVQASRLLIVGRVSAGKGQLTAIEAVSKLRNAGYPVTLRVVGGGDVQYCSKLANQLGTNGWVEFTGFAEQMDEHYYWADIALSCAGIEAMGRATAEAMSWGLPIAGHRSTGTGELVTTAAAGLLYDGSADDLARVIKTLIDNRAAADSMGEAGQRWARTHVSSECHANRIKEIVGAMG